MKVHYREAASNVAQLLYRLNVYKNAIVPPRESGSLDVQLQIETIGDRSIDAPSSKSVTSDEEGPDPGSSEPIGLNWPSRSESPDVRGDSAEHRAADAVSGREVSQAGPIVDNEENAQQPSPIRAPVLKATMNESSVDEQVESAVSAASIAVGMLGLNSPGSERYRRLRSQVQASSIQRVQRLLRRIRHGPPPPPRGTGTNCAIDPHPDYK